MGMIQNLVYHIRLRVKGSNLKDMAEEARQFNKRLAIEQKYKQGYPDDRAREDPGKFVAERLLSVLYYLYDDDRAIEDHGEMLTQCSYLLNEEMVELAHIPKYTGFVSLDGLRPHQKYLYVSEEQSAADWEAIEEADRKDRIRQREQYTWDRLGKDSGSSGDAWDRLIDRLSAREDV